MKTKMKAMKTKMKAKTYMTAMLAVLIVGLVLTAVAIAADRGPQRVTATLVNGTGDVIPPVGDTGRFYPSHLLFSCAAGETQTVHYVSSGVTHQVGTKVVSATDALMALTNVPPMFKGDKLTVTSNATTVTNRVTLIGDLFD